jgi:hypothetical protein
MNFCRRRKVDNRAEASTELARTDAARLGGIVFGRSFG